VQRSNAALVGTSLSSAEAYNVALLQLRRVVSMNGVSPEAEET